MHSIQNTAATSGKKWSYHPKVPIAVSPLFQTPLKPMAILKWFVGSWFPLTERLLILLLAIISWAYFSPSLEQAKHLNFDWVALIALRNLALMVLVAGGLHWTLYIKKAQSDVEQFDAKPFKENSPSFTFNNQVLDNMFWTCASGVTIWLAYEVLMMWAMANGVLPTLSLAQDGVWVAVVIFLIPIWETVYFYFIHRLLHWPPLYKRVHALHHRNTNVGPWSGMSMHPIEHIMFLGSVLIHFVIPANPLIIIFHLSYYALSAVTTHAGYDGINVKGKSRIALGNFHHQMHHAYFDCNYGGLEVPWDKWFGSFHDGTEASHQAFMANRRAKAKRRQ